MPLDINALRKLGFTRKQALSLAPALTGGTVTQTFTIVGAATVTTGTVRLYNPAERALTISGVRVSAGTAPTGAALVVDVKKGGTSIFPTTPKPRVAAGANTGTATPDTTAWGVGEYLTVDVTQIGSTVGGSDVVVTIQAS